MSKLIIHKPGFFTTIQDQGRFGYEAYGIPVSGAMDKKSARIANLLVGNNESEAVIEITLIGPSIEFTGTTQIAVTGANISPKINEVTIENNKVYTLQKGDILSFGKLIKDCRAYLAIAGSLDISPVMNSKSTYTYANLGGHKGRALSKGDCIDIKGTIHESKNHFEYYSDEITSKKIRLYKGPEYDLFSKKDTEVINSHQYQVSSESNRMGIRLNGSKLNSVKHQSIISSPLLPGTMQVPPSGLPIISMNDCGTTGGYPRLATIEKDDLNILAQLKPNDSISFLWI